MLRTIIRIIMLFHIWTFIIVLFKLSLPLSIFFFFYLSLTLTVPLFIVSSTCTKNCIRLHNKTELINPSCSSITHISISLVSIHCACIITVSILRKLTCTGDIGLNIGGLMHRRSHHSQIVQLRYELY